jgi:hypothetical protein
VGSALTISFDGSRLMKSRREATAASERARVRARNAYRFVMVATAVASRVPMRKSCPLCVSLTVAASLCPMLL